MRPYGDTGEDDTGPDECPRCGGMVEQDKAGDWVCVMEWVTVEDRGALMAPGCGW